MKFAKNAKKLEKSLKIRQKIRTLLFYAQQVLSAVSVSVSVSVYCMSF